MKRGIPYILLFLSLQVFSQENAFTNRAAQSHIFHNRAFGYQNNKIIFPADDDPACVEIFKEKRYSCSGSTLTSIYRDVTNKNGLDTDFVVATVKERARRLHLVEVKSGFIEDMMLARYDKIFTPIYHHFQLTELDCNLITKDLAQVFFDIYESEDMSKEEAFLDKNIFNRFYNIVTDKKFITKRDEKIRKSYEEIFKIINFRDGKNELSRNEYTDYFEVFENAIRKKKYELEVSSISSHIKDKNFKNLGEFRDYINEIYDKKGYFNQAYYWSVPMVGRGVFKN
ncbi:hypothetical protein [Oceanihabitans sediminis]|uniref:hypothetical protein n=1 Tax=Oceanihabitans sediminis TaxID=1812012 RepID=UPI003A927146